jgi:curli biogenesis system outer membrane secretion channel CsgG
MTIKLKLKMVLLVSLLLIISCGTSGNANYFVRKDVKKFKINSIAILDFEDNNSENYKSYFPEATKVTENAIQSSFLLFGYNIIERNQLKKVLAEQKLQLTGLTNEDRVRIGRLLNADLIVMGSVTAYVQGSTPKDSITKKFEKTHFGFTIKGIDVETGNIIFSGVVSKQIDDILDYTKPIVELVNSEVQRMVEEMRSLGLGVE